MTTSAQAPRSSAAEDIYQAVGRQLRAYRIGRGMTQAQVAQLIEVSPQQYQKYEDAQSKCSLTNLSILAKHYGIPLAEFLPERSGEIANLGEADLLARLVAAYSQLRNPNEKLRIVQLVEAMQEAQFR